MWNLVTAVMSTLIGTTVLGGLFIRYVLIPHLRTQLIDPILVQLASVLQLGNEAITQVHIIVRAWDGHLEWSQREVDRVWSNMMRLERVVNRSGKDGK